MPHLSVQDTTSGACVGCSVNQYSSNGTCVNCPPYSVAVTAAASALECRCLPGYQHASDASEGACTPCPIGQYSAGAAGCLRCRSGSTTADVGAPGPQYCGAGAQLCTHGYIFKGLGLGCISV